MVHVELDVDHWQTHLVDQVDHVDLALRPVPMNPPKVGLVTLVHLRHGILIVDQLGHVVPKFHADLVALVKQCSPIYTYLKIIN